MQSKKVGARLKFSFRSLLATFIFATIVSLIAVMIINSQIQNFYNRSFQNNMYQVTITGKLEVVDKEFLSGMALEEPGETEEAIQTAMSEIGQIEELLESLRKGITNMDNLNRLNAGMEAVKEDGKLIVSALEAGDKAEAYRVYTSQYIGTSDEVKQVLEDMSDYSEQKAKEQYTRIRLMGVISIVVMIAVAVLCIFYSTMLGNTITDMITSPIHAIEVAVAKLKDGDLDIDIDYKSEDELGVLAANFNATCITLRDIIKDAGEILGQMANGNFNIRSSMADRYVGEFVKLKDSMNELTLQLSETLGQIDEASEQVAMGSVQLSDGAQALAEGATDQAGAVEELNAIVGNVSRIALESAQDTENAYETIVVAEKNAEKSKKELSELTNAMERISDTSKEIQNIIGAIEDIASQTNLLSLNASIEAARAGEAGKGFAVVAGQIGKLAADSAQSAVDTRELIEKSLQEIEAGNIITEKTVAALEDILTSMNVFAQSAQKISDSSKNQANMLKQVETGIEQISEVVQTNSASAEETSATSEELSAQSESLRDLVAQFELQK